MDLKENWQFIVFLMAVVALGWQILRSNRDMFLRLASKEDISRIESRLNILESSLTNLDSRVSMLETRIVENESKRLEGLEKFEKYMESHQEYMAKIVAMGETLPNG